MVFNGSAVDVASVVNLLEGMDYKTVSTLTAPLIPRVGEVLGGLQFINKLDADTNATVAFLVELVPLASGCAVESPQPD
jgi:hypothetical protein